MNSSSTSRNASNCYFLMEENGQLKSQHPNVDIFVIVFNSLFSISATVLNAVVLVILSKTATLRRIPSHTVVSFLALSDFLVGLVVQPLVVVVKVKTIAGSLSCTLWAVKEAISWTLCAVSLLTLALVSMERYLALYLHMRYHEIVTMKRLGLLYASFYPFSVLFVGLWLAGVHEKTMGIAVVIVTTISLVIILTMQYNILKLVRYHQLKIQRQINAVNVHKSSSSLDFLKYKRSTGTLMIVVCLSFILYVPFICTKAVLAFSGFTTQVSRAYNITWTILYVNSSMNPCIYCLRMRDIRQVLVQKLQNFRS